MPASGAPPFQAAVANVNPFGGETTVNTENPDRGPVLIIAGDSDNTAPTAITHASHKYLAKHSDAVTELVDVPDRGHSLTIDHGWQEVAEIALGFVKRFGRPGQGLPPQAERAMANRGIVMNQEPACTAGMLATNIASVTDASPPSSKTARTRARLMAAAFHLFARQGYEQTTVAQIAAAAGVTEMTFYRHFGSKVQLLIDDPYDPLIAAAIGEQPGELPPLIRTVRGIRLAWQRLPITDEDPVRERVAIAAATPSLLPALRASTSATETAIAEQLVADGSEATDAAVAAAAAMSALMTGLMRWAVTDGGALGAAVERSLDVLEPNHD